ncbi:MAG TPA: hypothetical protein VGC42_19000 [Kofleriaceae bacterium]
MPPPRGTAAALCLLLGACGTSAPKADGAIDYTTSSTVYPYPTGSTVHIEPDGSASASDVLSGRTGSTTLSADLLATLYQQATDAHVEDLPAVIPCGCDAEPPQTFELSVVIDGQPHQTTMHQLDTPPAALVTLTDTLARIFYIVLPPLA